MKPGGNNLSHTGAHVDLALDLLAGPASGLDGPVAVLAGGASFPNQGCDPVVAEVSGELTVGESIREITVHVLVSRWQESNNMGDKRTQSHPWQSASGPRTGCLLGK